MTDRNKLVIRTIAHLPESAGQRRRKYGFASFEFRDCFGLKVSYSSNCRSGVAAWGLRAWHCARVTRAWSNCPAPSCCKNWPCWRVAACWMRSSGSRSAWQRVHWLADELSATTVKPGFALPQAGQRRVVSAGMMIVGGLSKFLRIRLLKNGYSGFEEEEDVFQRGGLGGEGFGVVRGLGGFDFSEAVFNLGAVVGIEVFLR